MSGVHRATRRSLRDLVRSLREELEHQAVRDGNALDELRRERDALAQQAQLTADDRRDASRWRAAATDTQLIPVMPQPAATHPAHVPSWARTTPLVVPLQQRGPLTPETRHA